MRELGGARHLGANGALMRKSSASGPVALGIRVKTGRAVVVALRMQNRLAEVVLRTEISLTDSATPATTQPHHEVMHLPWERALRTVAPIERKIRAASTKTLGGLLGKLSADGASIGIVGITGGTVNDPGRIANPHIRAHAAEGRLFREATEFAARACKLVAETFAEADVQAIASRRLGLTPPAIAEHIAAMGRSIKPWRADEKLAALVAWMAIESRARGRR